MEQILYYYHHRLMLVPEPLGDVLNIGLGKGYVARLLLDKRSVSSVTSVEISQEVANTYVNKYNDPLEQRHTVIVGDARDVHLQGTFDLIYVDIIQDLKQAHYTAVKDVFQNLNQYAVAGTKLVIEYQADNVMERELKEWLEARVTKVVTREVLSPFGRGRSGQLLYYVKN